MPDATPGRPGGRLYSLAALLPLAFLGLVLAAQTLPYLDTRALWFSDEVRYGNAFQNLWDRGHWLVLYLNGAPYPDKPPVYFWLLAGLRAALGETSPALFLLGAAVSALLTLAATCILVRRVAGGDRDHALAAGLVLLTCFSFIGVGHYSRMDLLFAALITLAHVCLHRAWTRPRAPGWQMAGWGLAALATLTKGPFGLAFPLLAGLAFLAWRGDLRRFFRKDTALGLGFLALVLLAWVAAAWFGGEHEYIENIFHKQIYKRAVDAPHHGQGAWYYLGALPLAGLPWTFLLLGLPWRNTVRPGFWRGLWAGRKAGLGGAAYLWCAAATGLALLSAVSIKLAIYLLPLYPPLAALAARAWLDLAAAPRTLVLRAWGGLFLLLALGLALANPLLHNLPKQPWPVDLPWPWLAGAAGAAALLGALLLRLAPRLSARGGLLLLALGATAWLAPLALGLAPALDPVMSPKEQSEVMADYVRRGYAPMAFRIYSGTYTYYAGADVFETQDLDLLAERIAAAPKAVVGMQKRYWDEWKPETRPAGLQVVHSQTIVEREYVLAVKEEPQLAPPDGADAPDGTPASSLPAPAGEHSPPAAQTPSVNQTSPPPASPTDELAAPQPATQAEDASRPQALPAPLPPLQPEAQPAPTPQPAPQDQP
ncbi:MAG: glycosyltransferase family 39 protein [Thermodesulfobacteriota bacterium]